MSTFLIELVTDRSGKKITYEKYKEITVKPKSHHLVQKSVLERGNVNKWMTKWQLDVPFPPNIFGEVLK
jgi:hypothetical protein